MAISRVIILLDSFPVFNTNIILWLEHRNTHPVLSWKDEIIPLLSGQSISFIQNPTAAPSGAHVSGLVMQASHRKPKSTHCFCVWSVLTALLTWKQLLEQDNSKFLRLIPKLAMLTCKCAFWTFKQQLALKMVSTLWNFYCVL